MGHTFESAAVQIDRLRRELDANGRTLEGFAVCLGGAVDSVADVERWESIGVTRLLVSPWRRSPEALDGLATFASRFDLDG
jgi:hypothetical protein